MKTNISEDAKALVETTCKSQEVFHGNLLHVFVDEVELPDHSRSHRDWINHPGACAVVPVFEDGSVMLVKQFRYPVRQIFYEVPAGKIDPNESPETTALRETEEETGLQMENIKYIGHFYPCIGYSDEIIHIYAAWGLKQMKQQSDDDEFLLRIRIPYSQCLSMIQSGELNDGKTICALTQTKMWWEKEQPFPISFT